MLVRRVAPSCTVESLVPVGTLDAKSWVFLGNSTLLAKAVVVLLVIDLLKLPILILLGIGLASAGGSCGFLNPNRPLTLFLLPRLPSLLPELPSGTLVNALLMPGRSN